MNQGGPSNQAPAEDDGYAQMLSQLQDQRDSFKNEYRRDVNKLGGGASMQNAQDGTGRVAKSDTTKFLSREKTSAIFDEMVMQGYNPEEAQMNLYNSGDISEQDYDFVQGLQTNHSGVKKWSRDEITNVFDSMINEGATPEEAQESLYSGHRISEQDYDFVRGLGETPKNAKWSREKTSAIFDEFLGQGYSVEEARNNIYNMNVVSEKDYDFVRGLGAKKKKLKKRGGQSDSLELTTKQIAQIMAAGGSVKYV